MSKEIMRSDNNEMLLCFDEQGNAIAPQPREAVHGKRYHVWHAITNIWVLNNKAEILCTRRALHISGNPGKWQTYVGGHVRVDSTFSETAKREIDEEIGLKVGKDDLKLIEKGRREDNKHVYKSYAVLFNGNLLELNFSDGEVGKAQWLRFEEYQKSKVENPDKWCNGMKVEQYKKTCEILGLPYQKRNIKSFLNKKITATIDRPLGSLHPKFGFEYEVNYGFIPNTRNADGEEVDAYVLGIKKPLTKFRGKCVAIIHRTNDNDDKLIIIPTTLADISNPSIKRLTHFQEKLFKSVIIRK